MNPNTAEAEVKTQFIEQEPQQESLLEQAMFNSERRIALEMKQFEHKQRLANLFAKSGCFADIKKDITEAQAIAQAFVKIELGESMGFTAAESMQGVHLISGTPAVNAQLRAARMQRAGFHWDIDWFENEAGVCEGCRLWLYRNGKPLLKPVRDRAGNFVTGSDGKPQMEHVSVAFVKKDAEMLKTTIWENNQKRSASVLEKDNWKNTPRNMYFARAVTNAQRFHAAGVLSGEIPSTEEAMDMVEPEDFDRPSGSFEAQQAVLKEKLAAAAEWKAQQQNGSNASASGGGDHAAETGEPEAATGAPGSMTPASKPKLQFGGKRQ